MPIPSPSKGQSQKAFIASCMSSIGKEYSDSKQALAICFSKWRDKKAKASHIVTTAEDEYAYSDDESDDGAS